MGPLNSSASLSLDNDGSTYVNNGADTADSEHS